MKLINEQRLRKIIHESINEILNENPRRLSTKEFIQKAKVIHGNRVKYNKVGTYKNNRRKVNLVCPQHGVFRQRPKDHLRGQGCPMCYDSKLESMTANVLKELNVIFERRVRPSWMQGLELDIFIPSLNIAIECQGIQHYQPVSRFGGVEGFNKRTTNDAKKIDLCKQHGIQLYHIKYDDKNVRNTIQNIIANCKSLDKENMANLSQ